MIPGDRGFPGSDYSCTLFSPLDWIRIVPLSVHIKKFSGALLNVLTARSLSYTLQCLHISTSSCKHPSIHRIFISQPSPALFYLILCVSCVSFVSPLACLPCSTDRTTWGGQAKGAHKAGGSDSYETHTSVLCHHTHTLHSKVDSFTLPFHMQPIHHILNLTFISHSPYALVSSVWHCQSSVAGA